MKINQIKIGVVFSYLQMGLHIIVGLVYTPIMLRLMGQSEYGLYNTAASTISTLNILSLGFSSSYIKYYSHYKKRNETRNIHKLNGLYLLIFTFIGLIAAVCGIFLMFHLELVFDKGFSTEEYKTARLLMLLFTIDLSLSFPTSVFTSIIGAYEKFFFQKLMGMIQTVLTPCLTIPLLMLGYGSVGLVTVSLILSMVVWIVNIYYCVNKLNVKFVFCGLDWQLFKSLFTFSAFIAINMVVDQINWNIDKILLGRYRGTAEVAVYAVGFSLYSYYQSFSTSISNIFTPRIHKIVNDTNSDLENQRYMLTELFTKVGRIQFLILGLLSTGIIFFGKDFIEKIWTGHGYEDSYYVALLLIIPSSIALIQNLGIEVQRAQNRHQFRSIVYVSMAFINLVLSIFLCQLFGAIGSAVGTAISLVLANGMIMNVFYYKRCYIDIPSFWRAIGRMGIGLIFPCIFGAVINQLLPYSLWNFTIKIMLYSLAYIVSMWFIALNEYEKNLVRSYCKRITSLLWRQKA